MYHFYWTNVCSIICGRGVSHNFLFPPVLSTHLSVVKLSSLEIRDAVKIALQEDLGTGDVTSLATVPTSSNFVVVMRAREAMTIAGLAFAEVAFRSLSRTVRIKKL